MPYGFAQDHIQPLLDYHAAQNQFGSVGASEPRVGSRPRGSAGARSGMTNEERKAAGLGVGSTLSGDTPDEQQRETLMRNLAIGGAVVIVIGAVIGAGVIVMRGLR